MIKEFGWVVSVIGAGAVYHSSHSIAGLAVNGGGFVLSHVGRQHEMLCPFCAAKVMKSDTHCEYCRSDIRPQPLIKKTN